jgi:glycosyltransferase involved in cell wall biosynthesis
VPYHEREKAILAYDRWDIGNKPQFFLTVLAGVAPDVKLKIGGFWHPSSLKDDFLGEVKRRNLGERVELLGPLNEEMIRELCSRVMLHVHLNQEAFGMQTLEAAACGCCVIIPAGSGVADIFKHGESGYFPQENDLGGFIDCAKIIFSDLKKAEEMGRRAWQTAQVYTWPNYARNLEAIIKRYVFKPVRTTDK